MLDAGLSQGFGHIPGCLITMHVLTEWEGRTGTYYARGYDGRTERSIVCHRHYLEFFHLQKILAIEVVVGQSKSSIFHLETSTPGKYDATCRRLL